MAIPSRQIGWGTESNLLWQISKQLEYLATVTATSANVTVLNDMTDPVSVIEKANSTGANGTTPYKLIATNSTNETNIKDTSGNLYSITAIGLTSSVTYLKLYNLDVVPDFGTDIPVMTIPVPANTQGAGVTIPFLYGINFSVGISFAITGLPADDDATPVDADSVIINLTYA